MPMKAPVHPGRIVKGCLEDFDLSITDAAQVLGVTRPTVSKLVNGRAALSPEMAIRLAKAFGSTPAFWLRLQFNYDLALAEEKADVIQVQPYTPTHASTSVAVGV